MTRYRRHKKKKEGFFTKCINGFFTLLLTCCMLWGLQACSNVGSLKFAQISDIHYSANGANTTFKMISQSPNLFDDAIAQMNEINNLDFVMITGDLIDRPLEKELTSVSSYLEKINAPWYFAFGNHDRCIGGYLTTNVYFDILNKVNKNFKFKKSYYSFEPKKGYKAIVLDTIITDKITSNGYINEEEYKWLKKELDSSKNSTVLIFMHVPIIEPFASPNHKLKNATDIKQLLESYKNPIGVFQGHYHATKITQHGNVLYVNSPALVSYPNAFRVVTVTNYKNKAVFEFEWKETRETVVQKMAKIMAFSSTIYSGDEKDQKGIYEVEERE